MTELEQLRQWIFSQQNNLGMANMPKMLSIVEILGKINEIQEAKKCTEDQT